MRKVYFPLFLLALLFLLVGCQDQRAEDPVSTPTPAPVAATPVPSPSPTPTPTVEPTPEPIYTGPWPDIRVPIDRLDLSSYEGELSPEEWEALSGFFPVLNNEVPMLAAYLFSAEEGVTPTEEVFFWDIYAACDLLLDTPFDQQGVMAFTLTPVAGEEADLIFSLNSYQGCYLLIHRVGERFYAVYMGIRWFSDLQTDGLFMGSGGAAVAYVRRIHFTDGTFTEELLANTSWGEWDEEDHYQGYYAIGGQEVTEDEFYAWQEETLVGNAIWYPARAREE